MAPGTNVLTERLLIYGQHFELKTEVPVESGIRNLYDAYGVGFSIEVQFPQTTHLNNVYEPFPTLVSDEESVRILDKALERCNADEDASERLKGADHRALLYDIFSRCRLRYA